MRTVAEGVLESHGNTDEVDMFVKVGPLLDENGECGDKPTVFLVLEGDDGVTTYVTMQPADAMHLSEQLDLMAAQAVPRDGQGTAA